jgi:hypothetical protein
MNFLRTRTRVACFAVALAVMCCTAACDRKAEPTSAGAKQPDPPPPAEPVDDAVPAEVDARVELLSIAFRLIKAGEYNQPSSASPYSRAVADHFGPHVGHRAILLAAKLREERSIGFDAVASFAAHLKDVDSCEFAVPLEPWPKTLDKRWDVASATAFARALKEFVRDTEFRKFWDQQRPFREQAEVRMKELLSRRPLKRWIESFFGVPLPRESRVLIGLLNGPANYGSSVQHPGGRLVVFPTIGAATWDSNGLPVFDDRIRDTVVHEFCHPLVNPLVDEHLDRLMPAGQALHKLQGETMAAQAYVEPRTLLYESLVRACVVQILTLGDGDKAGAVQLKKELSCGFWWTPALVGSLARYSKDRERFRTLAPFMPELAGDLRRAADDVDAVLARVPKVVAIHPNDGSKDLNPDVSFRIEFDRAMDAASRGLSFEKDGAFEVVTPGRFDETGRVYTTTLRFRAGASVRAWVNRFGTGLMSEEGYAASRRSFEFKIK